MTNHPSVPAASPAPLSSSFPEWVLLGPCVVVRLSEDRFMFVNAAGDVFRVQLVAGEFIDPAGAVVAVDDGFLGLWDVPFILGPEFGASYTYDASE